MMKNIISKIEQKENELKELRSELDELGKKKYEYLIDRYYLLASTTYIKIRGINYVDDEYANVECLRITGGKYDHGRIEVIINDDYDLRFIDIDDKRITEISRERFTEFLYESLEETKKVALEFV